MTHELRVILEGERHGAVQRAALLARRGDSAGAERHRRWALQVAGIDAKLDAAERAS